MKLAFLVFGIFAFVVGAPNTKDNQCLNQLQINNEEVQNLVNCKSAYLYPTLSNFSFDVLSVPIKDTPCLVLEMFKQMGFIKNFNIKLDILARFIVEVKRRYNDIPYHNWTHAFVVTQFSFVLLKLTRAIEKHHLTPLDGLALLTAAICHDIDHPGTSSQYQITINSSMAQRYQEEGSVLERHHSAIALDILNSSKTNFVSHLDKETHKNFSNIVKEIILATDLAVHLKVLPEKQKTAIDGYNANSKHHQEMLRAVFISCADIGGIQVKDWKSSIVAAKSIMTEFFNQGDMEKKLGLEPLTMMDRCKANIPKEEMDFISSTVIPVFQVLASLYPETKKCVESLQEKVNYWKKSISYFEEQVNLGRNRLDIISDPVLATVPSWTITE